LGKKIRKRGSREGEEPSGKKNRGGTPFWPRASSEEGGEQEGGACPPREGRIGANIGGSSRKTRRKGHTRGGGDQGVGGVINTSYPVLYDVKGREALRIIGEERAQQQTRKKSNLNQASRRQEARSEPKGGHEPGGGLASLLRLYTRGEVMNREKRRGKKKENISTET